MALARCSLLRSWLVMTGVAVASLMNSPASEAGYVNGFTGSVTLTNGVGGNTTNGIINFAVWQGSGNWLTDLGVGGAGAITNFNGTVNPADMYVYLYEIVNTDAANALMQLKVTFANPGVTITSMGTFNNRIFLNGMGQQVGPVGNQAIGNNGLLGTGTTSSGPGPAAAINSTGGTQNSGNNQASFAFNIPPAGYSSIVYVTTNVAPVFQPGQIRDNNGGISVGNVPGVVPEPASFVLLLGGVGIAAIGLRRVRGES